MPSQKKNVWLPPAHLVVALDCEFVGAAERKDLLGRVSIVSGQREVVLDVFVEQAPELVVDYRTHVSGLTQKELSKENDAKPIDEVRERVRELIQGKIVVGHGVQNDLTVIGLPQGLLERKNIRDTAIYRGLRSGIERSHQTPKLSALAARHLGKEIQQGVHDSVEDAKIALEVYMKFQLQWERNLGKYLANFDQPNYPSGLATNYCSDYEYCYDSSNDSDW